MDTEDQNNGWPEGFLDGYLSGYVAGIEHGRTLESADMDRVWQPAYQAAMATAATIPDAQHRAAVKARQAASCQRQKQEAQPWDDEVTV